MSTTTARLNMLIKECYQRRDVGGALDTFRDFQISQCYNPYKQRVFDSHSQTYRKIFVPCGRCYHCLETKINSWVTRMYAHLEDYAYCYFITLTYRSFTTVNQIEQLMLNKLSQAVWHYDDLNFNHHPSYNPCLLVKKHYQDFLKRLRKNTGNNDITFVLSGEYGHRLGRPHFHILLFSKTPITRADIVKAWSVALWRDNAGHWTYRRNQKYNGTAYDFPIGRVDFNDLVANGTLNTTAKIRVDGNYLNASKCFAYVCKYVCKQDDFNTSRVQLAFNNLYCTEKMCNDPELGIIPLHAAARRAEHLGLYTLLNTLIQNSYEENLPLTSLEIAGKINYFERTDINGATFIKEIYPSDFIDFRTAFAPFVEFSRGTPIGSIYARNHLSEFSQGVYNKPLLQERGFVVPSYFRLKARHHVFGLRKLRKTISGNTYPKGGFIDLYRRFESSACEETDLCETVPCWRTCAPYRELLQDPQHSFKDLSTGEHIILCAGRAQHFIYDRHKRDYVRTRQIPVSVWIADQLARLARDFELYKIDTREAQKSLQEKEEAYLNLARLGHTYRQLNRKFVQEQTENLNRKNKEYHSLHNSVE